MLENWIKKTFKAYAKIDTGSLLFLIFRSYAVHSYSYTSFIYTPPLYIYYFFVLQTVHTSVQSHTFTRRIMGAVFFKQYFGMTYSTGATRWSPPVLLSWTMPVARGGSTGSIDPPPSARTWGAFSEPACMSLHVKCEFLHCWYSSF